MGQRILCYGDSNTYGYDPRSYLGGRHPKAVRWTGKLEVAGWEIIDQGENGRSIPRLDSEIEAVAQAVQVDEPEVLTVILGGNDLAPTARPHRGGLRSEDGAFSLGAVGRSYGGTQDPADCAAYEAGCLGAGHCSGSGILPIGGLL